MQTDPLLSGVKIPAPELPKVPGAGDLRSASASALSSAPADGAAAPFAGVLGEAVGNLRDLERRATGAVEGLLAGDGVDVHSAMIAVQKSDQAFEMALAVRGKMVSAYQSLMGVQF
jgi:flagellar hook-basal body complex protein FliE